MGTGVRIPMSVYMIMAMVMDIVIVLAMIMLLINGMITIIIVVMIMVIDMVFHSITTVCSHGHGQGHHQPFVYAICAKITMPVIIYA